MRLYHKLNQSVIRWTALSLVLVLTGISACDFSTYIYLSPTPSPRKAWLVEWLNNPSCQPPCFLGITPGMTTMTETVQILSEQPNIIITDGPAAIFDELELSWRFATSSNEGGLIITDIKGMAVKFMTLGIDYSEDLKLSEVIASFGEPDHLTISGCPLSDRCVVALIYSSSGMLIDLFLPTGEDEDYVHSANISPDLQVNRIFFIPPGENAYKKAFDSANDDILLKWEGYTTYKEE